jgi:hypothetical protein
MYKDPASQFVFQWYKGVMWLKNHKEGLSTFELAGAYIFVGIGYVLDVVYNIIIGSYKFKNLPREFTFTARLIRYKAGEDGWRKEQAISLCKDLNEYSEGHC